MKADIDWFCIFCQMEGKVTYLFRKEEGVGGGGE